MPELIKNAKEVSTEENVKNKREAKQYIYLNSQAVINGNAEPVVITIFEDVNGNRYYNHILPVEETNNGSLPVYPAQATENSDGIPAMRQQAPVKNNIPQNNVESNNVVNNGQEDKDKLSRARQNNENMSSPSSNNVYGKATEVITDSGKAVNVTYKLVSSDDLVMSHNPNNTFSVNKNYPSELQPRDRERASMQTQVNKMANSLRPADLASSRNLNNGAPIVNGDNVVINGNGRSMAIYRAQHAKGGKGKAYNEYLAEHAEEFGFTREQVEAVKNPVLVREVAEADQATTNDIINSTAGGARMSPSEQAKVDAEKVTPAMMDFYDGNEKGDLTTPGNKGFIGRLLHAIMDDNSENAYTDDKGNVNADGLQRIKRVLYYLAYRDDEMLAKMAESTDDNIRNVSTAMLASAPKMAQNNLMMEAGERNNVDITTPLVTAIKRYASIKKANGDINEYLEARDLFEEYADSQLTKDLVKFFEDNKRKVRIISELLNNAVEAVKKLGDPNQMSLFEGEKIPSGEEIVRGALNKTIRENNPSAENMNSLFEDNNTNETTEAQPAEQESQKAEKKNGTTGITKAEPVFYFDIDKLAEEISAAKKQDSGKNKEAISNDVVDTGNTQPTGIFSEFDQQDLLDAFGMTTEDNEVMAIPKLEGVTDIDAEIERLEKEISKELNNISANPIFNPNLYMMAAKLAMAYMHKGINSLKKLKVQFAAKFGSDFSEEWGPAVFETVKTWPTNIPFNETQVLKTTRAVGALYDHGTRDLNSIEDRIFANLSTANRKRLSPMVESAYNGIKIFFDNMEANKNERPNRQSEGTNSRPEGVQSEVTEVNEKSTEGTGKVPGGRGEKKAGNSGSNEGENTSRVRSAGVSAGTELEETAGRGDSERGNKQPSPDLTPGEKSETPTEIPGKNWEIKESAAGKIGEKTRYNQNVAAIKLLKQLEAEGRMPTPAEQEILAAYNGWGSLADYFNANRKPKENAELRELLTPEEYKSAVSTINDAFYTSPGIVRAVWEGVSRLGFKGGRVLDPSMGVGNFFGCMPRGIMNKSSLHGVEIDNLTSRLAAMLYPEARVDNVGFEKSKTPDNFYDLVISNVPFSSIAKIDGYLLHNYFFANGIDKTRPGGLMVFITSQGTLTNGKDGARMRSYLTNKADMIAAYKLPTGAFDESGTQVVTDIVIFQKHGENGERSEYAQNFTDVKTVGTNRYGNKAPSVNNYFLQHKENIIGEMGVESTYQGPKVIVKIDDKADIAQKLNEAMQSLPEGIYKPVTRKENKNGRTVSFNPKIAADNATRDYEYYVSGGKVYQKENGNAKEVTGKKATVIKDYIKLRDVLDSLIATQLNPEVTEKQLQDLRVQLNKTYDAFVKKHGYLNEKSVAKNFNDDPMAGMVMALEKARFEGKGRNKKLVSATKNDIFSKRTVEPIKEVTQANSPADALLFSLNNKGEVDLDYMAELMQAPKEAIIAGLKGRIYKNPLTEEYEAADEYLSGNVRQKLAQAEAAAEENPEYMDNVEALQKALPEDLVSSEIYVNLGSPWVPVSDIQDFINHLTGKKSKTSNVTYVKDAGKWVVDGYLESPKFSCPYMSLDDLLNCLLNNKSIEIYTQTRDKQKILNDEATNATNAVANQIKEEFQNWIWTDKEREERLVRYYNNNFNNSVVREYDGSHLTFPGMNSDIHMRSHQKNVIWRMLQKGNTLIAHCVGAGKTFEMQAAGMEMRRLGIARKPLYLLPNNVVEQFAKEFRQLYPNAKLLVLTTTDLPDAPKLIKYVKDSESGITKKIEINIADLSEKERAKILEKRATRNRTLARIQTEDWDGIIMSHNMFQRLPMSPENTKATIQEQLDIAKSAYTEARMSGMSKSDVKRLEERISNLETKLDAVLNMKDDDIGIPFEKIGVDQVFVDEADLFKNLGYYSTMNNIKGLPNSNAARSFDMFAKTQWLSRAMGGRGIVFATGTPIANTMAEMYTMLRYLDLQGLKVAGLDNFDNWLRTFADIGADVERKPSGDGYRTVNRAKGFINMPELSKMFRKVADIKRQEDLDLDIPQLKNGHPTVVKIKPDPEIEKFLKEVVPKRIAAMKANRTGKDNMLVLTNDLRKMAFTDAKINACADQITNKFNETADIKGAQVVFCDIGVPKDDIITTEEAEEKFNTEEDIESEKVYERLVRALIARGIPREQIAIAQSAKNREQLEEMFKKVDSGDIRIIIGSTTKMGAGTNFQHHLVALHDLDAPWRPRDIEQRHGRILRQGNPNKEVEIFNYVVQDSFDANMWEKLKNKATMIGQAMSNHSEARTVEDVDAVALEFADIEGAATADPRFKERIQLDKDIKAQKAAQIMFQKQQAESKRVLEREPAKLKDYEERKAKVEKDIAERTDTSGDKFKAVIDGKVYTKRTDADKALTKVLKNVKGAIPVTIGKIGDMDIKARETEPDYTVDDIKEPTKIAIQLVNNWSYNVKTNSIAGLENTLKDGPEKVIKNIDALIDESQQKINLAEETLKAEDPYSEKLKKMQARFNQLDRELKGELVGNNAQETPVNQPASEEQKAPEAEQSVAVDEEKESEKAEPEQATPTVPTNEEYWNTDDREHTKTGAMMYCVTAKEQVDKDTYKQIADIAKKHGKGYWNRFNKAFTFTSAEDRAAFMEEAGAILAGVQEAKYSGEGTKFAKMINSNEYVADEDLTTWQKMLQEFGRILGMPVTFFKNKPYLHGYHVNGRTFINVNSDMSLSRTVWHETFHWLRNNNPALYDAMVAYIAEAEGIGQAQIDKYKSDNGRTTLTNEEAVEEMMADAMQDVRNRVKFLKDLGKENKTLAQRFVEWIHRIMDRFTDFFNVPGGMTTKQKNAMSQAFEKLARDMVDANGKPIFETSENGKIKFSAKEDIRFSVSNDTGTKENVSAMTESQMMDEVKQVFPTARNINADGSSVTFTLPNGHKVTVDYVKRIGLTEAEKRQAAADYGREITDSDVIEGRYHGLGQEAFIEIAEGGREGTINHEAFHYAMEAALTQKMKDFLNKKYKSEEAMAEAYRKWCNDRLHSDKLGKIWNKVKDFASSISNLLGIQTKQGIFKDISSGDVFESANNLNRIKNKLSVDDTRRISLNNPPINEDLMNEFVSELNSIIDNQVKSFEEQGYTAIEIADMFNQEQYSYYNFMNTDFTKALTKFISKYRYNYKLTNKQKMSNQEIYDYLTNIAHANFDSHEEAIAVFDYISKGYKEVLENANRYLRIICGAKKEVEQIHYQFRNWRDCETYHNQHGRPNDQEAEKLQGTVLKNVQTYDGFKLSIGQQHKNYLQRLWDRLMTAVEKANGIGKNDAISVRTNPTDRNNLNPFRRYFSSPSRLAEKADVHGFKSFYTFGTRAMNKLTKLRADFTRKLNEAMAYVEKNKTDKEALYDILWQGDAEGKEYTKKQLQEMGASDNVIKAYGLIRNQMRKAYRLLNEARTRVQTKSAIVSDAKLQELNGNKFVEILSQKETPQGTLVTYKEKANWIKTYLVDEETLDRFYQDENMQVISAAEVGQNEDGDKLYSVEAREAISDINKLGGYIPHFFHEYMVREKTEDGFKVVASGRNVKEAYQKAEEYIKNNPDAELSIAPKAFDFSALGLDEKNLGALVGDEDYDKMAEVISAKSDVDLKSAKEFLDGIAHKKGRHRFFGNFLQRKGAKGFEQDLDWVLRHYFNAASRYVAMETEFKPKAISLFERLYGRFDDDHSGVAKYVKEYINDINGNPAALEQAINNLLNSSRLWRALAGTRYGERAALQLSNDITGKIAVAKLGFFNVSSALINLTQLANAAAYLGDVGTLWQGLRRGAKKHYTMHEQRVLMETNVLHDIGLDSGSGYGKASFGNLANKTMVLFKTTESIARKGTVLAAYDKSIKESDVYKNAVADGMSKAEAYQKACKDTATHQEAIAYAKEVNIKSNFDYGVNDAPNMMRRGSILGQLFYQFKKYPIKQMEVMQDFAPVFSNKTSAKQKAIFWGTQFLLAGLFGSIPFWKLLDSLWEEIFGTSPEKEIKKSIMLASANDPLLKELAKVTMYGLGAAANVDISARVGLGDIVPSRASDLVGPALSSVKGVLSNGFNGDGVAALRSFSPGLANVYMAATGKSVGARNRTTSVYDGAYDRLLRLLGFRSADEAVASDIQGIIYNDRDKLADEKKAAIDEYLANPTTANAKRLKELGVKPKTVKDERKRKEQDKLERAEGALSKKDRKSKSNNDLFQFAR